MPDSHERALLAACQLEIERAWNDASDDAAVHRLAAAHPELAEELYDFLADLIEAEDQLDGRRPELAELDGKVRGVLGLAPVESEPRRAKSFLALVRDVAGESVDAIAASMDITADFLVDASEHGAVLPRAARAELVRRACATRAMDEREAFASFDVSAPLRRAASRDRAYEPASVGYADIVKRSSLSAAAQELWLGLD